MYEQISNAWLRELVHASLHIQKLLWVFCICMPTGLLCQLWCGWVAGHITVYIHKYLLRYPRAVIKLCPEENQPLDTSRNIPETETSNPILLVVSIYMVILTQMIYCQLCKPGKVCWSRQNWQVTSMLLCIEQRSSCHSAIVCSLIDAAHLRKYEVMIQYTRPLGSSMPDMQM